MKSPGVSIAGVILAGGKSSRMGMDKSTLPFDAEKSLLQQMQHLLEVTTLQSIYISHDSGIQDEVADKGPLGGVHASLKKLRGQYEHLLFVPVDMPSLQPRLLQQLIDSPKQFQVVRFTGYILPFRLKIEDATIGVIEEIITGDSGYSLRGFQQQLDLQTINSAPADIDNFVNINTSEEWRDYQRTQK